MTSGPVLTDVDWRLQSITYLDQPVPIADDPLVIRTDDTFETVLSGCTPWTGKVKFHGHQAVFRAHTAAMKCPPQPPETRVDKRRATALRDILTGATIWYGGGNTLAFTKPAIGQVVYSRGPADPPSPS